MAQDEQKCLLCKEGVYRLFGDTSIPLGRNSIENFGIRPHGAGRLILKKCDTCGNIQIFKPKQ